MKIILLPGLDGTGLLFEPLIKYLPEAVNYQVFSFENLAGISYQEQAQEVANGLAAEPVLLVGESYSGPIVYQLCGLLGAQVKGVVFLASFISSPSLLARCARFLPMWFVRPNMISRWLAHLLGFNLKGDRSCVDPVFNSLSLTDKNKLTARLSNIANIPSAKGVITCPAIYLQPDRDLLVSKKSIVFLQSVFVNCRFLKLPGGHFIAQSNPAACAKIINVESGNPGAVSEANMISWI